MKIKDNFIKHYKGDNRMKLPILKMGFVSKKGLMLSIVTVMLMMVTSFYRLLFSYNRIVRFRRMSGE